MAVGPPTCNLAVSPITCLSKQRRLWADQEFTYGTVIPNDMISFLLGVVSFDGRMAPHDLSHWIMTGDYCFIMQTFCLICPIIAPFALVYFLVAYIAK